MIEALSVTALVISGSMLALWLLSVWLRDVSIVDWFWGLGFVIVAWVSVAQGAVNPRSIVLATLVTIWGVRLAGHIFWRNHGAGEDRRYQKIRAGFGEGFWWKSLYVVFGFQGLLVLIISAPIQAVAADRSATPLGSWDAIGMALWAMGLFFESVGDAQLARFKADPTHRDKVMDQGLWRYTRHPNYFGDACVWWGIGCFALAIGAAWTLFGPLLMTLLLLKVSGVSLLERTIVERRPAYRDYIARTSSFLPWFPRANAQ